MKMFRTIAALLCLAFAANAVAASAAAGRQEKVVYHVNDATNAMMVLGNIRNHLNASPKATIVVVTHGAGIDFLIEDAKDKNGNPYDAVVQELSNRNVKFRICNNTLEARKIDRKRILPEATIVPSGVAEVARLQFQEDFVYLKP